MDLNNIINKKIEGWNYFRVGLVGYSNDKFDHELAEQYLRQAFETLKQQFNRHVVLVSGWSNCGIPALGYKIAKELGWKTEGISAEEVKQYDLFPVDYSSTVGLNFGDESEFFINSISKLIRVGGGKQSLKETQMAKDKGIPIIEYELELNDEV